MNRLTLTEINASIARLESVIQTLKFGPVGELKMRELIWMAEELRKRLEQEQRSAKNLK